MPFDATERAAAATRLATLVDLLQQCKENFEAGKHPSLAMTPLANFQTKYQEFLDSVNADIGD